MGTEISAFLVHTQNAIFPLKNLNKRFEFACFPNTKGPPISARLGKVKKVERQDDANINIHREDMLSLTHTGS